MRVVGLPAHGIDADPVAHLDPGGVVDEAGDDALLEQLARQLVAEVLARPRMVALVDPVDAVEEVRDPPDAAFGQREAQRREGPQHPRPQEVGGGLHDVDRLQRDQDVDRSVGRGDDEL